MVLPNILNRKKSDLIVTESEYNPKKFQNEFDAFKRRIGKHSAWFNALDKKKQWDLLFLWKNHKWICSKNKKSASLKNFLREIRIKRRFYVPIQKIRESALNSILQK
jgi:hypothetical protein